MMDEAIMATVQRGDEAEPFARLNRQGAGLRSHLPTATVWGADAGTHVLLTLPPEAPSAAQVQQAARALGVGIYALKDTPAWLIEDFPNHDRSLLVGYTHLTETQIASGLARVGRALNA